jgi:hypothetical protein
MAKVWCASCHDKRIYDPDEFCEFCAYEAMGGEELAENWFKTTAEGQRWATEYYAEKYRS